MKLKPIHFKVTQYGFEWGAAKINRHCSDEKSGWIWAGLMTPKYNEHDEIKIYVTKTGKVRIYSKGCEWKPMRTKERE